MIAAPNQKPTTLTRPALGHVEELGTVYNASSDQFLSLNVFNSPKHINQVWGKDPGAVVLEEDCMRTSFSITTGSDSHAKTDSFNLSASLGLKLLGGLVSASGAVNMVQNTNTSATQANVNMVVHTRTKRRTFFGNQAASTLDTLDHLHKAGATHFVSEVVFGATVVINFHRECSSYEQTKKFEGELSASVNAFVVSGSGSASASTTKTDKSTFDEVTISVVGDIPFQVSPTTVDQVKTLIKGLPDTLKNTPGGLGVPIEYTLTPLGFAFPAHEGDIETLDELASRQVMEFHSKATDAVRQLKQLVFELTALSTISSLEQEAATAQTKLADAELALSLLPQKILSGELTFAQVLDNKYHANPDAILAFINDIRTKDGRTLFIFSDAIRLVQRLQPLVSFSNDPDPQPLELSVDATYMLCVSADMPDSNIVASWREFKKIVEQYYPNGFNTQTEPTANLAVPADADSGASAVSKVGSKDDKHKVPNFVINPNETGQSALIKCKTYTEPSEPEWKQVWP